MKRLAVIILIIPIGLQCKKSVEKDLIMNSQNISYGMKHQYDTTYGEPWQFRNH